MQTQVLFCNQSSSPGFFRLTGTFYECDSPKIVRPALGQETGLRYPSPLSSGHAPWIIMRNKHKSREGMLCCLSR